MTAQNSALLKLQGNVPLDLVPLEQEAGVLAALLLNQGIITEKQLNYALRVRKKIATPQTMLDTLIELGYVEREQVKESLRNSHINIRLGDLFVELGYLLDADLRQALGLQKESGGKKRLGEILVECGFIEERRLLESILKDENEYVDIIEAQIEKTKQMGI